MSYDKVQAGRDCATFLRSEGGTALSEANRKKYDELINRVFTMTPSAVIQNPAEVAAAVAEYQSLKALQNAFERIIKEAAKTE